MRRGASDFARLCGVTQSRVMTSLFALGALTCALCIFVLPKNRLLLVGGVLMFGAGTLWVRYKGAGSDINSAARPPQSQPDSVLG
jgi:hypothetical protein